MILVICHCGHDVATHHPGGVCLGMLCDCDGFANRDQPRPAKPKPAPPAPSVDDSWGDAPPATHPTGCTCMYCALGRMYP